MQDLDSKVQKDGALWFFCAGFFAIALVFTLYRVDEYLTHSDREIRLEQTLHELRSAQAALPSEVSDSRQVPALQK